MDVFFSKKKEKAENFSDQDVKKKKRKAVVRSWDRQL